MTYDPNIPQGSDASYGGSYNYGSNAANNGWSNAPQQGGETSASYEARSQGYHNTNNANGNTSSSK
jgi:hypothetical protein